MYRLLTILPKAFPIISRGYVSRIQINSILMEFLETSDCTDGSRRDETCLQFKMKENYIKTKISKPKIVQKMYVCL